MDASETSSVCSQSAVQELAKAGLSHRAAELFDWMRRLPDGHELASLCDVYTYTTGKHFSWSEEWLGCRLFPLHQQVLYLAQGRLASDPLTFDAASVAHQADNRHRTCPCCNRLGMGCCLHLVCSGSSAEWVAAGHQHRKASNHRLCAGGYQGKAH